MTLALGGIETAAVCVLLAGCASASSLGEPRTVVDDPIDIPAWATESSSPDREAQRKATQTVSLGGIDTPGDRHGNASRGASGKTSQPKSWGGSRGGVPYGSGAWRYGGGFYGGSYPGTTSGTTPGVKPTTQAGNNWPAPPSYGSSFPFNSSNVRR